MVEGACSPTEDAWVKAMRIDFGCLISIYFTHVSSVGLHALTPRSKCPSAVVRFNERVLCHLFHHFLKLPLPQPLAKEGNRVVLSRAKA